MAEARGPSFRRIGKGDMMESQVKQNDDSRK